MIRCLLLLALFACTKAEAVQPHALTGVTQAGTVGDSLADNVEYALMLEQSEVVKFDSDGLVGALLTCSMRWSSHPNAEYATCEAFAEALLKLTPGRLCIVPDNGGMGKAQCTRMERGK